MKRQLSCLVIFSLVSVSFACNENAVKNCLEALASRSNRVENIVSEKQFDEICNVAGGVETCLQRSGCLDITSFRNMWNGMKDSFNYLCVEERQVFLRHAQCFQSPATSQGIKSCSDTYQRIIQADPYQLCPESKKLLSCLYESITGSCPAEAGKVFVTYVYKILKPILTPTGCTLSLEFLTSNNQFQITNGAASYKEVKALLLLVVILITFVNMMMS